MNSFLFRLGSLKIEIALAFNITIRKSIPEAWEQFAIANNIKQSSLHLMRSEDSQNNNENNTANDSCLIGEFPFSCDSLLIVPTGIFPNFPRSVNNFIIKFVCYCSYFEPSYDRN